MKAHYRLATTEDVAHVADNLREADRRELEAHGHRNVRKVLEHGWAFSEPCYAMVGRYGLPFGLFGAVPDLYDPWRAVVWMMATDGLEHEALAFARGSRKVVNEWLEKYDLLFNWVDGRNEVHVKWLQWLGFQFISQTVNDQGVPFIEFVKVKHHV